MIFKRDLIDAINDTNHNLLLLAERVHDLETTVRRLEGRTCKCKEGRLEKAIKAVTEPKRRGRPVGSKNKKQKRDKSGKFVKE